MNEQTLKEGQLVEIDNTALPSMTFYVGKKGRIEHRGTGTYVVIEENNCTIELNIAYLAVRPIAETSMEEVRRIIRDKYDVYGHKEHQRRMAAK